MSLNDHIKKVGRSLEGVNASVDTINNKGKWKKLMAFLGPAYLISVGYMDPGNWATDLAAGSRFQYALIWVLLLSNMMALLLQYLSAKLGLVRGRDLAQASRETYPTFINIVLYVLAEIAIAATDLAEVLGMAIGLKLLLGLPILIGVSITILDTFLLLAFQKFGMRKMEAFIISLIGIIGISFLINLILARPDLSALGTGFIPDIPNSYALYIAIGIIGATVMPHNLYLHSALVQTRKIERSESGLLKAIKYNLIDSTIALNLAFFVNGAIMVLAAATFFTHGYQVEGIEKAHKLLEPLLGSTLAPILFAVALIAAGQSSTITSTLAGQVVMEGYLHLRIQPWIRRLITRLLAIIPAFLTVYFFGSDATTNLLILSQVILSIQLGFATIPLIHFVSDKKKMGKQAIGPWLKTASWLTALLIVVLNIKLVWDEITAWLQRSDILWLQVPIVIIAVGAVLLLFYITIRPWIRKTAFMEEKVLGTPHGEYPEKIKQLSKVESYKKIAITVDFTGKDEEAIRNAISQGTKKTRFQLIHVVESAGALLFGREISDYESDRDREKLNEYVEYLEKEGYEVEPVIGFGSPKKVITKIIKEHEPDILVMGAHGHKTFKDLIFGQTVDYVRHHVKVPVLIV